MEEKRTPGQIHLVGEPLPMEVLEELLYLQSLAKEGPGLLQLKTNITSEDWEAALVGCGMEDGIDITDEAIKVYEAIAANSAIIPSLSFEVGVLEKFGFKYMTVIYREFADDSPTVFLTNIDNLSEVLYYFD